MTFLSTDDATSFPGDELQRFIYYRTYSRYRDDLGRREHWEETVARVMSFFREIGGTNIRDDEYEEMEEAFRSLSVVPSMRLVNFAGPAARRQNLTCYNCSALPVDSIDAFGEISYLLAQGVGVGFSVEHDAIDKLPVASEEPGLVLPVVVVEDSSEGWSTAFKEVIRAAYRGCRVGIDVTGVRPAGSRLVIKGGRSSGPGPLLELFSFTQDTIISASKQHRKLTSLEVHDIACRIASVVVVGGVRRSAMISLSDLDDDAMRSAKDGTYWEMAPYRSMSNNSYILDHKPSWEEFSREWDSLVASGTGERGLVNRYGMRKNKPSRRQDDIFYVNPCGEAILRAGGLCNLSESIVREYDTEESLTKKIRIAAMFGTLQSSLTYFPYVRDMWSRNAEEERLLGVSLTGCRDSRLLQGNPQLLSRLKETAILANQEFASRLGINPSVAVTLVKPSGTVSQLANCSSGIHARWSQYYIRRVRISANDSLAKLLRAAGAPMKPENGETEDNVSTWVVSFPVKSPEGALTRHDVTARDQVLYALNMQRFYSEHGVSVTVTVEDHEWADVGKLVYDNLEYVTGFSFLPKDGGLYEQAPYEEIDKETYDRLSAEFSPIPYKHLTLFETEDTTVGHRELSCVGGSCEI